jgi:hypothetical protein
VSARDIVGGLAGAAISAARNPLGTTVRAVGLAKGVASTGAAAAEGLAQHAADRMRRHHAPPVKQSQPAEQSESQADPGRPEPADADAEASETPAEQSDQPAVKKAAAKKTPAKKTAAKKTAAKKTAKKAPAKPAELADDGPQIVLREPAPPELPPIDVVGQALAAEADEPHAGRAGEPRGASRDEEHGEAALQRAEADEIAEETAEALPGGDVDVTTPVGTTGAGVGFNPDTAESDLQQPQTPPVVDPALTKTVKSAQRTGKKASTRTPKA